MKNERYRTYLLGFIFVALLFFVLNRLFFFSPTMIETSASYIMYPFLYLQRTVVDGFKQRWHNRATVETLYEQLQRERLEKEVLQAENIMLQSTLATMKDSAELCEFKERYETTFTRLVNITMRHCATDAHYILVDAGKDQGIEVDMVAVYKHCLVGRVTEVYACYSKVMLVTDRACKIAALCINTNVHGIHAGLNTNQETELSHVSHLLQLQTGDLIISSGEGLVFPKGFGLGTITSFELRGLNYYVSVKPLIDITCINHCFIMQKIIGKNS